MILKSFCTVTAQLPETDRWLRFFYKKIIQKKLARAHCVRCPVCKKEFVGKMRVKKYANYLNYIDICENPVSFTKIKTASMK